MKILTEQGVNKTNAGDLHNVGAVWRHFTFSFCSLFEALKQVPVYFTLKDVMLFTVTLQKCLVDYETQ